MTAKQGTALDFVQSCYAGQQLEVMRYTDSGAAAHTYKCMGCGANLANTARLSVTQ